MLGLANRIDRDELMDTQAFDDRVTRRTLKFLGLTARRFGGAAIVIKHLEKWSSRWPANEEFSILDVGCGGGEIPLAVARWARKRNVRVRLRAIDLVPEIAEIARDACRDYPEIEIRRENLFDLAARGETFDYVTASLFLHHVHSDDVAEALRTFDALARRGVLISDLRRSLPSLAAVTALSWVAGNHVVRHDAPLSVRRAFTPRELAALARSIDLPYLDVEEEPFFRLSLAGEKS